MRLDPQKCPIGTLGYVPPLSVTDFAGEDFDWFKEPSVLLSEDRSWIDAAPRTVPRFDVRDDPSAEVVVFADWKSAIRYTLERERENAQRDIAECQKTIDLANAVEKWLDEAK